MFPPQTKYLTTRRLFLLHSFERSAGFVMIATLLRSACAAYLILMLGAAAAQAAYYDDPKELDVTGPYTQPASGMVFPEAVRNFKRTGVVSYNSERTDESVDYEWEVGGKTQVAVTVYVYPVPADLGSALAQALPQDDLVRTWLMLSEQLFSEEEQAIVELHRGSEVLNEEETSLVQNGISYPGFTAAFRYREDFFGEVQPVRSQLFLFPNVRGNWMVKYRVTYPETVDGASQATAFLHGFPWTIRQPK